MRDGLLPHVEDAIRFSDSAWRMMSRKEVSKSWMRSDCLGVMHMYQAKFLLTVLKGDPDVDIDLTLRTNNSTNEQRILSYWRKLGKYLNP